MKAAKPDGFTLIELIVAVAIVATLAAIALPSYETQIQQTRRSDGTSALITFAQRMERYFLESGSYSGASTTLYQPQSTQGHYRLSVTATPSSYLLEATPTGVQASDSACGTLTLDQLGTRGVGGTADVTSCW